MAKTSAPVDLSNAACDRGGQGRQLVVFLIEGQRYGLELGSVERVIPMVAMASLPEAPAITLGVINLHGVVVPTIDVRRRFGLPARHYGLTGRLLVARSHRRTLAFPVDDVEGVIEISTDAAIQPDVLLPGLAHVAGVVALPDGLLFIHDLEQLLSLDEDHRLDDALDARER